MQFLMDKKNQFYKVLNVIRKFKHQFWYVKFDIVTW